MTQLKISMILEKNITKLIMTLLDPLTRNKKPENNHFELILHKKTFFYRSPIVVPEVSLSRMKGLVVPIFRPGYEISRITVAIF